MRLEYRPAVRQDVAEAMRRYRAVSQKLADDFKAELRGVIAMAGRESQSLSSNQAWFPPGQSETLYKHLGIGHVPATMICTCC
jgi:hypothetical protein